jgi:hypothetical protein
LAGVLEKLDQEITKILKLRTPERHRNPTRLSLRTQ